jgi:hypothetical protein
MTGRHSRYLQLGGELWWLIATPHRQPPRDVISLTLHHQFPLISIPMPEKNYLNTVSVEICVACFIIYFKLYEISTSVPNSTMTFLRSILTYISAVSVPCQCRIIIFLLESGKSTSRNLPCLNASIITDGNDIF